MITGNRPWKQFDSDAQVFRQLGKQNTPTLPRDISPNAASLLDKCFLYDIDKRPTALQLLDHEYILNVDPLSEEFFDFPSFWRETEVKFQERIRKLQQEAMTDSDSDEEDYVD
jgi:serine/threonine protein kinase